MLTVTTVTTTMTMMTLVDDDDDTGSGYRRRRDEPQNDDDVLGRPHLSSVGRSKALLLLEQMLKTSLSRSRKSSTSSHTTRICSRYGHTWS